MDDRRILAEVADYSEFLDALRHRACELKLTRERIDAISGLPDGYTSKVLCVPPMRSLGCTSFGPTLEALAVTLVLVENPEALARYSKQFKESMYPDLAAGKVDLVSYQISRKKLSRMARLGGKRRAEKLTPKRRSMIARKASRAAARQRRRRAAARKRRIISRSALIERQKTAQLRHDPI